MTPITNNSLNNASVGFLFDLDGVLIDSETEYTKIWGAINDHFKSGYDDLPTRIKGMTLENIINTYFNRPEIKSLVPQMLFELENKMKYEWLPGARELLEWLRKNNIPTVLVTSSNDLKMNHLREEIPEAESFFTHIVTGDKVSKSKPDPEGYLLGAKLIGVPACRCVVFEDSLQGVKAGEAAGAFVVGVVGTLSAETLQPHSNKIVTSLTQISPEEIIKSLSNR